MTPQLHMSARRPSYFSPWKGEAPAMMASPQAPTRRLCPPPACAHLDHLRTRVVGGPAGERRCEPPASCYPLSPGARGGGPHSPTAGLQEAVPHLQGRHAEVRDADVVFLIQKQVLGLQVSVAETGPGWGGAGGGSGLCTLRGGPGPTHCLSEGDVSGNC